MSPQSEGGPSGQHGGQYTAYDPDRGSVPADYNRQHHPEDRGRYQAEREGQDGPLPDPMGLSRQITELPHHPLEVQVGEKGIERVDWRRRAENAIVQGQGMGELRPAS